MQEDRDGIRLCQYQYKKHTILLLASFPSSPFYLPSSCTFALFLVYYFRHMDTISLASKLFFSGGRWDLPWVRGSVRLLSRVPAISWNLRWEWNRVGEMEPENKNGVSPMQWALYQAVWSSTLSSILSNSHTVKNWMKTWAFALFAGSLSELRREWKH